MKFDAAKAAAQRVVLIAPSEDVLRVRALSDLLAAAGVGPDDFDYEVLQADESPSASWVASVSTVPFLAERRVTIVRHLFRAAADPLGDLPATALLVLVGDDDAGGDEAKLSKQRTALKNWTKAVEAAKGVVYAPEIDGKAFVDLLAAESVRLGKKLDRKATVLLQEMVGGSFSRGIAELEKLVYFVGDRDLIESSDVKRVVAPSREWSIWSLIGAVVNGNVGEALVELRTLVGAGTKAEEASNRLILPQLYRQVRLMLQARTILETGRPADVLASEGLLPEKHLGQEKDFTRNKVIAQAKSVSHAQCARALARIAEADAQLKGALPAADTVTTLELLLQDLATILRK